MRHCEQIAEPNVLFDVIEQDYSDVVAEDLVYTVKETLQISSSSCSILEVRNLRRCAFDCIFITPIVFQVNERIPEFANGIDPGLS